MIFLTVEYIKKLLGDLKEPLIPHEVCNHVKKFAKFEEDAKMKLALEVVQSLSKNKRDLLAFLMNFFRRFLANQSYTDVNCTVFMDFIIINRCFLIGLDEFFCAFEGHRAELFEAGEAEHGDFGGS